MPTSSPLSLISVAADGTTGNGAGSLGAGGSAVSANGRYVVFESAASDLIAGQNDVNGDSDVFIRNLAPASASASAPASAPASASASGTASGTAAADAALERLFRDSWDAGLSEDPVAASILGDRRWNDKWADFSLAAVEAHFGSVGFDHVQDLVGERFDVVA